MTVFFQTLNPILQAVIAATIAWAVTALGASTVFLTREFNRKLFDAMMGFAAGIMLAVCFWSLLEPAVRMVGGRVMPALVGLLTGGLFFWNIDKILPHLHSGFPLAEAEGVKSSLRRSALLVLAITLHNIPEGLAIGVAYGAAATGLYPTTLAHGHYADRRSGNSGLPGRTCSCAAPATRRHISGQEFWLWSCIRAGRTNRCGHRRDRGSADPTTTALCTWFLSRSNAFRHSRGADS